MPLIETPYTYTTYIAATPQRVYEALVSAEETAVFWGHRNESGWSFGSIWRHERLDGSGPDVVGLVLAAEPGERLAMTFDDPSTFPSATRSEVLIEFTGGDGITRVTVTHADLPSQEDWDAVALGWPAVMANLKTYLETGSPLPSQPWLMG